jgi:hypothetical protein
VALQGQEVIEASDPLHADRPIAAAYGIITSHLADLSDIPTQRMALQLLGFALGSLVYWRDAWQDRSKDKARGRFNPLETQDHDEIRNRIATMWRDFCSSLGDLSFVRHGDLIAQIQTSTGHSRQAFLQLQTVEEDRKKALRKRQKKVRGGKSSCRNCCDCRSCPTELKENAEIPSLITNREIAVVVIAIHVTAAIAVPAIEYTYKVVVARAVIF